PELEQTVNRALALGRSGDPSKLLPLLYGRWSYLQTVGRINESRALAQQFLDLAGRQPATIGRLVGHRLLGSSLHMLGKMDEAYFHLTQALALFDERLHAGMAAIYGADLEVATLIQMATIEVMLGHDRDADRHSDRAYARAVELGHANTLAYCGTLRLELLARGERVDEFAALLERQTALVREHKLLLWASQSDGHLGWLQLRRGDPVAAVASLLRAIDACGATNFIMWRPLPWMWLGEAQAALGDIPAAEAAFAQSMATVEATGCCWLLPELYRLRGGITADAAAAGASFGHALDLSAAHGSVLWVLQIALDMLGQPRLAAWHGAALAALAAAVDRLPEEEVSVPSPTLRRALDLLAPAARRASA
ncbi:MAG: hypothetical protein ACRYG4_16090, partial [Janthinobacterium lividum]